MDEKRIIHALTLEADQKESAALEICDDLQLIALEPRFHRSLEK